MFSSRFHPLKVSSGVVGKNIYNGGKGGDAPATPDYTALAREQAAGNLALAKYTTEANRVNQVTPYGTITYSQDPGTIDQAGYDAAMKAYNDQLASSQNTGASGKGGYSPSSMGGYGFNNNPMGSNIYGGNSANKLSAAGKNGIKPPNIADYTKGGNQWTATQTLSPAEQAILNAKEGLSTSKLGYAQDLLNKAQNGQGGVDMSQLPSYGINPGETYSDAIMRRLQPQMQQAQQSFESQMANQGVVPGTQAYDNAYRNFAQGQNDQRTSAITGGMNVGLAANNQAFNQGITNMNQPINMVNSLENGSQVQNPQGVNTAQMPQVAGPDLTGAAQNTYNSQLANYNAQNAASNGFLGGLVSLGGAALGNPSIFTSDINAKENIKKVGSLDNGLNLYSYNYKDNYDLPTGKQIGVMAQEVEKVIPEAVVDMPNGFKGVNYAMLGA